METVNLPKDKLNKVLIDVEILIEDVSSLLNQEEIVKKRLADIKGNPLIAVSEKKLDNYLEKRGI